MMVFCNETGRNKNNLIILMVLFIDVTYYTSNINFKKLLSNT